MTLCSVLSDYYFIRPILSYYIFFIVPIQPLGCNIAINVLYFIVSYCSHTSDVMLCYMLCMVKLCSHALTVITVTTMLMKRMLCQHHWSIFSTYRRYTNKIIIIIIITFNRKGNTWLYSSEVSCNQHPSNTDLRVCCTLSDIVTLARLMSSVAGSTGQSHSRRMCQQWHHSCS